MKTQNYLLSSKILFTVVAIYFCSMQICMAQYQPFPSKGSMWIVNDNAFPYCKNIDYFSHNDTLINGKAYTQVLASIENYYCTGPPIDTLFVYAGCYRNDTVAKKVYWFSKDSLAEYLLYTFDVKVGDTLQSEIYNMIGNTQPIDVKLKDSVLLNDGTYRNSYWIGFASQSNPTQRIIEGIGSDGGLIEPLWHGISNSYTLICFTMDSTSLYPAWGGNCSPNVPSGLQTTTNYLALSTYPNPNHGIFYLPSEFRTNEIKIYNSYGQEIDFTISYQHEIDISTQQLGLYFVKISDGKKVFVAKVMKED
nr:T9SS type A sorting domain-containing protein [Bacteroidota bacterium]